MDHDTFDVLILIGRPATGKSEIIDFLKHTAPDVRRGRYHIAELDILDDFPMLWTWFEEDRILSQQLGQLRLYTDEGGYFKHPVYWHLLIERLSLDYQKRQRDDPVYHDIPPRWSSFRAAVSMEVTVRRFLTWQTVYYKRLPSST